MDQSLPEPAQIAGMIDHALLAPNITFEQMHAGLAQAVKDGVFSVCVQPGFVKYAVAHLRGSRVKVGTVVGFPHGATTTATKVAETREAVANGAAEVDMVLNISQLTSGMNAEVRAEIQAVVQAAKDADPKTVVKVILETAHLTDEQVATGSQLAEQAGADFVKTSTGFAGGGATVHHLQIMAANVSAPTQLKASGGVRDLTTLLAMRELGVTRFGTSATTSILAELAARKAGRTADISEYSEVY